METRTLSLADAVRLAQSEAAAGRVGEAETICRTILAQKPDTVPAQRLLARICGESGRHEESAMLWRGAAAAPGVTVDDLLQAGLAARAARQHDEGLALFGRAAALEPARRDVRAALAAALNAPDVPAKDQAYQYVFEQFRLSPYMDYPRHVQIETWARCNAGCDFCPYPGLDRQDARMETALFERLIDDLTAIPRDLAFELELSKVNEPFLDKRIFDFYHLANDRLPNAHLYITTNGSPLTERALDRLQEVRNVAWLCVSINDHRPDRYRAVMKIPFERTYEALRRLHSRVEAGRIGFPVTLSRVGDGTEDDIAFLHWCQGEFPLFRWFCYGRFDWTGQVETAVTQGQRAIACKRWFDLSIMATGAVALCCIDGAGTYAIGDVRQSSILEVYNAPGYRKLRQSMRTRIGDVPCGTCTYL